MHFSITFVKISPSAKKKAKRCEQVTKTSLWGRNGKLAKQEAMAVEQLLLSHE